MKKHLLFLIIAIAAFTASAQTQQQADSIYQLGRNVESAKQSRKYAQQALNMYKALHGEVSDDYINALNLLAASYSEENNFEKAAEIQLQVMNLCEQLDHPHPRMDLFAQNMGYYAYMTDDYQNSTKYWEIALPLSEKHSEKYQAILQGLALMYENLGDIPNLSRIMALMEEHNQFELTLPCEELKCMKERAQYYASKSDNAKAKEWYLKATAIAEGEERMQVDEEYGTFLATIGEYTSAAEYTLMAANLKKDAEGETEAYATLMYKTGMYSYFGKQYQQAVDCYEQALEYFQHRHTRAARANRAKCLKGMGNAYSGLKNHAKAIECYRQVMEYYEAYDKDNDEYPKSILNLAKAEKFNKDYEASIAHHLQAMEIFEARNMTEEYSDAASSLQLCYTYAGIDVQVDTREEAARAAQNEKLDQLIKEEKDNLQLTHDYLGMLMYARSLGTIAGCYYLKEEYDEAVAYYQQYMTSIREALRTEFSMQSEAERMTTWNEEKDNLQEIKEMLVTLPVGNEQVLDSLCALLYDVALLSKGILLNSSIEFEKVIATYGNAELKALYEQTKANTAEIERLRATASSETNLERILRLTEQNQALQLQLYKGCSEIADFTNYISYNWKDVKNALGADDIAIEFLAIRVGPNNNENYMVAIVLTQDSPTPVIVPICNLTEVQVMSEFEQLYDLDIDLIWGAMKPLLNGKRRIFFSPDGGFNHIGIEYLKFEGNPLSEQFEVYRLSSTKELCYHRQQFPMEHIALFGDIDYNDGASVSPATQADLLALRGQCALFSNLDNTKREIDQIHALLQQNSQNTIAKLKGTEASRAAFLSLTDSQVNLIHIATHGMYIDSVASTDAESMQYSRLAFAGANLNDDGLVTAADIAKMNLRQCDLAVLSACETGLGKISDDGVFGLQRGFKNAGVHTLLMSLKNVHDNATADLMISFYTHLTEGLSKREALVKAQQGLRDKGYTDAKYWATFILLDAIE